MNITGIGAMLQWSVCCLLVLFRFSPLHAQCGYDSNGYLFLHPFFTSVNWQATIYQSDVYPSVTMCNEKPVQIAFSRAAGKETAIYTTSQGKWMRSNAPLVDDGCLCCLPVMEFGVPAEISLPAGVVFEHSLPFHVLNRGDADGDSVLVVAANGADRIYCLHVNTASGVVGGVDTVAVPVDDGQSIHGVWGEPGSGGRDTAVWIGGSNGLLYLVPFNSGTWGTPRAIGFDDEETVTCIGGGYAGSAAGKIFRRSGSEFEEVASTGSSALRKITAGYAVGDGGRIAYRRGGSWSSRLLGSADYRHGNNTGAGGGTAIELLDSEWKHSITVLFDSATTIKAVSPSSFESAINNGIAEVSGNSSLKLQLYDYDDNRALPSVTLKGEKGSVVLNRSAEGVTLLRHDPSAICTTQQAFYDDTTLTLYFESDSVKIEARARKGILDPSCKYWKWQNFTFNAAGNWRSGDTLVIAAGSDTLRLRNSGLVTVNGRKRHSAGAVVTSVRTGRNGTITITPCTGVRRVSIIDAAGRLLRRHSVPASGATAVISGLSPGVHFIGIEYLYGGTDFVKYIYVERSPR